MALTREQRIHKAYKDEMTAAWDAMNARCNRAMRKRDKALSELNTADTVGKTKRSKADVPGSRSKRRPA